MMFVAPALSLRSPSCFSEPLASAAHAAQYASAAIAARAAPAKNIFHVKYVSEGAVYLDGGRNAGLEEGMLLHLVHADPNGGTTEAVRFQGQEPIADVRIFSVADSSSRGRNHQIARRSGRRRYRLSGYAKAFMPARTRSTPPNPKTIPSSSLFPTEILWMKKSAPPRVSEKVGAPIENQMRGRIGFDYRIPFGTGRRQLKASGAHDRCRHEPHRRHALEFHGILARQFEYAKLRQFQRRSPRRL